MKNPVLRLAYASRRIKPERKTKFKNPLLMEKHPQLILSPAKVYRNDTLTVRSCTANFEQRQYIISDESGRVIRQGFVNEHISEFKLCMVGLATGVYQFTMGQVQERFVIIT